MCKMNKVTKNQNDNGVVLSVLFVKLIEAGVITEKGVSVEEMSP